MSDAGRAMIVTLKDILVTLDRLETQVAAIAEQGEADIVLRPYVFALPGRDEVRGQIATAREALDELEASLAGRLSRRAQERGRRWLDWFRRNEEKQRRDFEYSRAHNFSPTLPPRGRG